MSKLDKIVEDLSSLTVLEAADLAKLLEEKWGVSAAAPVAVAAAGGGVLGGVHAVRRRAHCAAGGLRAFLLCNGWYASKSTFYLITSTPSSKIT